MVSPVLVLNISVSLSADALRSVCGHGDGAERHLVVDAGVGQVLSVLGVVLRPRVDDQRFV